MAKLILTITICFLLCGCSVQRYYNTATQQEETYFYSTDKEVKIGDSLSEEVEKRFKPDNDPLIQQRVNEIGQKIAEVNERKDLRYYFKVLDEKEVNAFAIPGGYVYIFKGLWDKISNDDSQIAAVIAHEVAHIAARHSIKRLQSALGVNVLAVMVAATPSMDGRSKQRALAGINELILAYSREDELQSDLLSINYLSKSGYNPTAILDVLEILEKVQREKPIGPAHQKTHPYISERKKTVRQLINNGNIGFDDYINTLN